MAIGEYAAEWQMEACQWDATAAAEQGLKADYHLASAVTRQHLNSQSGKPCVSSPLICLEWNPAPSATIWNAATECMEMRMTCNVGHIMPIEPTVF